MFVRGDEQSKAVQEMQSADNPDEIDISDDEDDEEEEGGDDGEYIKMVWLDLTQLLLRRATKEEGEGGCGGDGCAGQGLWRTQETHCRINYHGHTAD